MGMWKKPVVVEVEPDDTKVVEAMAERGWKVVVSTERESPVVRKFPDVEMVALRGGGTEAALDGGAVRLGMWMEAAAWLDGQQELLECVVLKGWMAAGQVDRVRRMGYGREFKLLAR